MAGLDLGPSLRTALINDPGISGLITEWQGEPAVFTRRPTFTEVFYPLIVISEDVAVTEQDGLKSDRPIVVRDIIVYGHNPDDYRAVDEVAYQIRELFHREKNSIVSTDYHVVEIRAIGPIAAPSDDEEIVGRIVTLTIQLRSK